MKRVASVLSDLICSNCGNKMTISREVKSQREKYHIKDLYCIKCKEVTKHIEVRDLGLIKKELEYKETLSEMEKKVYDLTHKEREAKVLCMEKNI